MKKILETDLFAPVAQLFKENGFKVGGEVNGCDAVAVKGEELIIIEMKTNFTVSLLLQAVNRQRISENVFIVIPKLHLKLKKWREYVLLVRRLGLGLITVDTRNGFAEVITEPTLFDIAQSLKQGKKQRQKLLTEFKGRTLNPNIGGSTREKLMTAYKEKSLYIACCFSLYGKMSPKALRALGADERKTLSILRSNYNGWFYRIQTGIYDLTEDGLKAIDEYPELTQIQRWEINKKYFDNQNNL